MTFLFEIGSSEFLEDEEDEGKRQFQVNILRFIKP